MAEENYFVPHLYSTEGTPQHIFEVPAVVITSPVYRPLAQQFELHALAILYYGRPLLERVPDHIEEGPFGFEQCGHFVLESKQYSWRTLLELGECLKEFWWVWNNGTHPTQAWAESDSTTNPHIMKPGQRHPDQAYPHRLGWELHYAGRDVLDQTGQNIAMLGGVLLEANLRLDVRDQLDFALHAATLPCHGQCRLLWWENISLLLDIHTLINEIKDEEEELVRGGWQPSSSNNKSVESHDTNLSIHSGNKKIGAGLKDAQRVDAPDDIQEPSAPMSKAEFGRRWSGQPHRHHAERVFEKHRAHCHVTQHSPRLWIVDISTIPTEERKERFRK